MRVKFMGESKFPLLVSVYKGEQRILIIPVIDHTGGFSVDSEWFQTI